MEMKKFVTLVLVALALVSISGPARAADPLQALLATVVAKARAMVTDENLSRKARYSGYLTEDDYRSDQMMVGAASMQALLGDENESYVWRNARTGNGGEIRVASEEVGPTGTVCRALVERSFLNGRSQTRTDTRCVDLGDDLTVLPKD